jgi:CrcB protein
MVKWIYLILGSVAGGFARYLLSGVIYARTGTDFPYGTFVINISGCFLIGVFNSLSQEKLLLGPDERILLMTGFCGAYTTFSTFMLETSNLMSLGELRRGLLNIFLSVGVGFIVYRLGAFLGKVI